MKKIKDKETSRLLQAYTAGFRNRCDLNDEMFEALINHFMKGANVIFCEFDYCIYNKDNECILKNISISGMGLCNNCMLPDIENQTLEKFKQTNRERIK